jgi:hypothetical protein
MSNKEIVQQGLDARKDVRAAEARAAQHQAETEDAREARFHDQIRHKNDAANWQQERERLEWNIGTMERNIHDLVKHRDALIAAQKEDQQRRKLIGIAKAVAFFVIVSTLRDLDLVTSWLGDGLMGATGGYLIFAICALLHKKK